MFVAGWLQAGCRLVAGWLQAGCSAGAGREACLLALALHDGEAGGRLHERREHAGRVLVREVLREALEGAAVGHRALDGQLELGPAQGAA